MLIRHMLLGPEALIQVENFIKVREDVSHLTKNIRSVMPTVGGFADYRGFHGLMNTFLLLTVQNVVNDLVFSLFFITERALSRLRISIC
jgi:hypothetical protein